MLPAAVFVSSLTANVGDEVIHWFTDASADSTSNQYVVDGKSPLITTEPLCSSDITAAASLSTVYCLPTKFPVATALHAGVAVDP
jgi:hypothetical protein